MENLSSNYHEIVNYHRKFNIPVADHCIPNKYAFFFFENENNKYWNPFKYSMTASLFNNMVSYGYDTISFHDSGGLLHPAIFVDNYLEHGVKNIVIIITDPNKKYDNIIERAKSDFVKLVAQKYPSIEVYFQMEYHCHDSKNCLFIHIPCSKDLKLQYAGVAVTCYIGFQTKNVFYPIIGWMKKEILRWKDIVYTYEYCKNCTEKSYSDDLYILVVFIIIYILILIADIIMIYIDANFISYGLLFAFYAFQDMGKVHKYCSNDTIGSIAHSSILKSF